MSKYERLIGVPFKERGRDLTGLDCWGVAMQLIPTLPEIDYELCGTEEEFPAIGTVVNENKEWFIPLERPEPGCLVTLMIRPPWESHIGVVLEGGVSFLSVRRKGAVMIERLDSVSWRRRIGGFYKWQR